MCGEDCPTASATTWTVMLARAMAGSSGMTLNVRVMPLPPMSIGDACVEEGTFGAHHRKLALQSVLLASPSAPR